MPEFSKSIKLFLMDSGDPNGRWLCELSNWTGKAYKIPRHLVKKCTDMADLNTSGVYFLFGYDIDKESPLIYIGETEDILIRLKQHLDEKDYWNEVIIFISKDDYLNKAHIKYLENRFHDIAIEAGRYVVKNSLTPKRSLLAESEIAEMEEFIYNAKIIVNILGHKAFEALRQRSSLETSSPASSEIYYISSKAKEIQARGMPTSDGFVVLSGSSISSAETKSLSTGTRKMRAKLIQEDKIVDCKFVEDVLFTSSSAASDCIYGMSSSGPASWKTQKGKTLKEIEEGK